MQTNRVNPMGRILMIYKYFLAIALTVTSIQTLGGEIKGRITDEGGIPLAKVLVCLAAEDSQKACVKTGSTNKNGVYAFKGLKKNVLHTVMINKSLSVTGRKQDLYPNYIWTPSSTEVILKSKSEIVYHQDIVGTFNFSNFQQLLRLTSADFPELENFDVLQDYVYLKVFLIDNNNGEQKLVFLGQVTSAESLAIDISVPMVTTELHYEIFSSTYAVANTISLTSPQL
ncbi:carboxypeptidase-like regulatory domain-containing protein [Gammaproteobacteria bacterium]|nr:carboxypeptidase-like regulatory domain-containing protein [Gammaproteobacteria bacterium]